jgi:A/G-specific adenine glycosylase
MRSQLLEWYALNRRDLPWRQNRDPYSIWVSEIMLQQTRVAVVIERYKGFMERFPSLTALAQAPEQEVLAQWSGLGYYRRARMLHKTAQFVAERFQGILPNTAEELRMLPGIGVYTAAAIASIAHNEPVAVVDGNVERVLCRLQGWEANKSTAMRRKVEKLAARLVDPENPGNFNQAMMELGATVCLPRNPQCQSCPIQHDCTIQGEHKTQPRPQMVSREVAFALCVRNGTRVGALQRQVLLQQRPAGLTVMPGLWELPSLIQPEVPEEHLRMTLRHAIMQVNYYVRIRTVAEEDVKLMTVDAGERSWVELGNAAEMALTGLTRKVLTRAHLLPIITPVAQEK